MLDEKEVAAEAGTEILLQLLKEINLELLSLFLFLPICVFSISLLQHCQQLPAELFIQLKAPSMLVYLGLILDLHFRLYCEDRLYKKNGS